jgi:hypothetical protein
MERTTIGIKEVLRLGEKGTLLVPSVGLADELHDLLIHLDEHVLIDCENLTTYGIVSFSCRGGHDCRDR